MKITFISDTHGQHEQLMLPESDMIIHAGDISSRGLLSEVQQFIDWFSELPVKHKVFIVGNHDFLAEQEPDLFRSLIPDNLIYLENTAVEIEGIKIWGSPITPFFFNWAFNRQRGAEINKYWEAIPGDTDILVTHGPPLGIGDRTFRGEEVGCEGLLKAIEKITPRYHVFGHIHEDYGVFKTDETTFINASVLNLKYKMRHSPVTIEW